MVFVFWPVLASDFGLWIERRVQKSKQSCWRVGVVKWREKRHQSTESFASNEAKEVVCAKGHHHHRSQTVTHQVDGRSMAGRTATPNSLLHMRPQFLAALEQSRP